MVTVKLNLVVLYTEKLPALLKFYEALGLVFMEEQHGGSSGLIHHSCTMEDGLVLELYPGLPLTNKSRLGFTVASIEAILPALCEAGGKAHSATVVYDPDGRTIELREVKPKP